MMPSHNPQSTSIMLDYPLNVLLVVSILSVHITNSYPIDIENFKGEIVRKDHGEKAVEFLARTTSLYK